MGSEKQRAVSVSSIREEYEHISNQRCECGGTYRLEEQMLMHREGTDKHLDSLRCKCVKCGAEKGFCFDVTALFRQYDQAPGHGAQEVAAGEE